MPWGTQVKKDGLAVTVEGRGTSSKIALRHSKPPPAPCLVCKGPHWRRDCPQRRRSQGSDAQDHQDWRCPGVPTQALVLITPEEPRVLIMVGGQFVNFLLDTGATYSVLTETPWPTFFLILFHSGTVWTSQKVLLQLFFTCIWDSVLFFTWVSDRARVSLIPFGEGYTEQEWVAIVGIFCPVRNVAQYPCYCCLCLQGYWCLVAAGLTAWGLRMAGNSTAFNISWVTGSTIAKEGRGGGSQGHRCL